jgi:hypothetical protein
VAAAQDVEAFADHGELRGSMAIDGATSIASIA